nr:hypothetical protein [Raoultibacter phocaeensis]
MLAFWQVCDQVGVPVAVERSRSGNGAHIWLFFSELVDAADARRLGCALVTRAMQADPRVKLYSYYLLFPSQDLTPKGGFGNAIALPFQGGAMRNGNSVFVDKAFAPYGDQWRFLSSVKSLSADELAKLPRCFGKRVLGDLADANAAETDELLGDKGADGDGEERRNPSMLWASNPKKGLGVGDAPEQVRIVRSSMLYIAKEGLSAAALNRLKRVAAFGNPEFYRAQAMRQSVHGKPRVLYFGEDVGDWLGLPRGCEDAVVELLVTCGSQAILKDERCDGSPIKVSFKGALRPEQKPAADALMRHDIGVLVAPTAFGRRWLLPISLPDAKRVRSYSF